jgi:hypothetical protein
MGGSWFKAGFSGGISLRGKCCRRRRKPDSSTSESINPNERIERLQVLNRSSFQSCGEGISSLFYLSTSVFEQLKIGSESALFASASTIASSVAASLNANFQKLSLPDLKQASLGASGQRVREIWNHARQNQPAVIFLDECEGMFGQRGAATTDVVATEIVQAFLAEWDGRGVTPASGSSGLPTAAT